MPDRTTELHTEELIDLLEGDRVTLLDIRPMAVSSEELRSMIQ